MATTPHSHDAAAGHAHPDHAAPHHHALGPTYESTVVMDVGGEIGGLVFYADAALLGSEIDIYERGSDVALTHTAVRQRHLGSEVYYAGVYPALAAGDYTLAPVGNHPAVDLTIVGGSVVEIHTERQPADR